MKEVRKRSHNHPSCWEEQVGLELDMEEWVGLRYYSVFSGWGKRSNFINSQEELATVPLNRGVKVMIKNDRISPCLRFCSSQLNYRLSPSLASTHYTGMRKYILLWMYAATPVPGTSKVSSIVHTHSVVPINLPMLP